MPKNSLYAGQKINTSEPGEQSPQDEIECPEDCPYCPPSRCYEDCLYTIDCPTTLPECIYNDLGKETAADIKFHALRDEGKLDEFGRRKGEGV